jgi:threonyl-tRNA synthetase
MSSASEAADHRKLGRALKLFDSFDEIGAGLPIWLPNGAAIRSVLERYVMEQERQAGYKHVYSPVLAKRELYERSGHWQHYHDDMFPPMRIGNEDVVLRPMLCPHHVLVYKSEAHSYRQLPLRIGEVGGQYRNELSGSLGGLSRVRGMELNDGHLFCREDQIESEIKASLSLINRAAQDLGVEVIRYRLSLKGKSDKYVNNPSLWNRSQDILRRVLENLNLPFEAAEGEAAFYGPKIDVQVNDAGRHEVSWTTVQLDFLLPERFDLSYVGEDGEKHRPVMIHRSMVGAMERIVAYLIERWNGAFPFWLAPVQAVVLSVGNAQLAAALGLVDELIKGGFRCEVDGDDESLASRVRRAHIQKVPFVFIIGEDEVAGDCVSVRSREGDRIDGISHPQLLSQLRRLDDEKSFDLDLRHG